jgi:hypothetical protein
MPPLFGLFNDGQFVDYSYQISIKFAMTKFYRCVVLVEDIARELLLRIAHISVGNGGRQHVMRQNDLRLKINTYFYLFGRSAGSRPALTFNRGPCSLPRPLVDRIKRLVPAACRELGNIAGYRPDSSV